MTCSKVALALSVLGTVGVGVIISIPKPPWRLFWWASWLSFLVGIALSALVCGFQANHLAFGLA